MSNLNPKEKEPQVLVIDQGFTLTTILDSYIKHVGFQHASSATNANILLMSTAFDLVIVNSVYSNFEPDIADTVRKHANKFVPIIAFVGNQVSCDAFKDKGVTPIILKPANLDHIKKIVLKLLNVVEPQTKQIDRSDDLIR